VNHRVWKLGGLCALLGVLAVFAVGSITFCGSLWDPNPANRGFNGPISRLLENVVRKFSGET